MGNFNRNNRGGGGKFGKRSFGGRDRQMHDAVCSNCGRRCQVPFRPTGEKPVFCSDCFEKQRNSMPQRSEGRDSDRGHREEAHSNVASFNNTSNTPKPADAYKADFEALNTKLDEILNLLAPKNIVPALKKKPAKKAAAPKKAKKK